MTTAYINKIATVAPTNDFHEEFVEHVANNFEDKKTQQIYRRMVGRANIAHRFGVLDDLLGFYEGDLNAPGIDQRMAVFREFAPKLAVEAVNKLELGDLAEEITHLVVVTCTGFFTPGIDFAIINQCGVPSSAERTQIAFMGCFSGVNGLRLAHHAIRSEPRAKVLVVALEISSIHLQAPQDLDAALSHLIFGDGCAAALITAEETGLAMDSFRTVVVPETEDLMTLDITSKAVEIFLSGKVPNALGRALKEEGALKSILEGAEKSSIEIWAIHPGGRSILDAVARAIELTPEEELVSRHVLNYYGNLASATILFVFEEILKQKATGALTGTNGCALAFGPGLTTESLLFRAV